ncbi:MAG TPA: hypothetical protein VMA77_20105 [Solirubrobacteraceae bacterium]|nr:hypothetical protein [Solirubrobacteraceae bacterium]
MTSGRQGEHPARAYGATGGGFAEGQADPAEFEQDQRVEGFATGQDDPEKYPEDEELGSFARGQEETDTPQDSDEGTFGTVDTPQD